MPHLTHRLITHVFPSPVRTSHHSVAHTSHHSRIFKLIPFFSFYHFQYCDIPSDSVLSLSLFIIFYEPNASPGAPLHFFHSLYMLY
ncbi:hypothetical protein K443DRAFT_260008 [Laccaria amethystina LaAM-08-1]|uniref:Uncharacterized protein n=1 Tax=Laccaria amethystina LaAM-08-1 TaxID=1095629 RepID=A0A0C9X6Y9_9AGAR|nr:hypothetical protein K443DRAFT_260008 [Laccaria amethystina LaAM-08-1]